MNFHLIYQSRTFSVLRLAYYFTSACETYTAYVLLVRKFQLFERNSFTLMPSTRRQKAKARRSREADIMSDIENMDVLIGNPNLTENRLDFDIASERSNSNARGSQSQENEIRTASDNTNELRNELNLRISQEMDSLMFSVNSQIQRTINEAINSQICLKYKIPSDKYKD